MVLKKSASDISCDLGSFVSKHFNFLIDIFNEDLENIGIAKGVYTKCLYTSVTMFYLLAGERAKKKSLFCYVDNVKNRMKKCKDINKITHDLLENFKKNLLTPECNKRDIFFVMLTDDDLPHNSDITKVKMFPGHVFIIDKQVDSNCVPRYKVYQSYINKYTLEEYSSIKKPGNNSSSNHMNYNYSEMRNLTIKLSNFLTSKKWTKKHVDFYKAFTLVEAMDFLNFKIFPYINFCYTNLPAIRCKKEILHALIEKRDSNRLSPENVDMINKILDNEDMMTKDI